MRYTSNVLFLKDSRLIKHHDDSVSRISTLNKKKPRATLHAEAADVRRLVPSIKTDARVRVKVSFH